MTTTTKTLPHRRAPGTYAKVQRLARDFGWRLNYNANTGRYELRIAKGDMMTSRDLLKLARKIHAAEMARFNRWCEGKA